MGKSYFAPPPVVGDGTITPIKRSDYYDSIAGGSVPAAGTTVASGFVVPTIENSTIDGELSLYAGFFGACPTMSNPAVVGLYPGGSSSTTITSALSCFARGTKTSIMGTIKARTVTKLNAAFEVIGFGLAKTRDLDAFATAFCNTTETTRDDQAAVAVIVDGTNDIRSYNNATAGDAAYTDSTFNADLTAATKFEIVVEVPTTATATTQAIVTLKLADSAGTVRTILNGVAPVATGLLYPVFHVNCDLTVYNLAYKVEVAA